MSTQPRRTWSRGQQAKLRAMHSKGFGFEAIALVVGHSANSCATKASELGIYKPKASELGIYKPKATKPSLVRESARKLARENARKIARDNFLQSVRAPVSETKARAQVRPCLNCKKPFRSVGPHNRLCTTCRGASVSRYDTPATVLG